jgi:hypothetical protein
VGSWRVTLEGRVAAGGAPAEAGDVLLIAGNQFLKFEVGQTEDVDG